VNNGDSLAFQVDKFLKENGDKIPADKKSAIEAPLASLKEAVKAQNVADIDKYTEEVNKIMGELYQAMGGAQQGGPQPGPQGPQGPQGGNDQPDEQ
jgi:molecular chaperone DnaK